MLSGFNTTVNGTERRLEKAANNIKYGTAAIATVGAGVGAAKLIKNPSIFTNIGENATKFVSSTGKEGARNIGKKIISSSFYVGIFESVKRNVLKVGKSLKDVGIVGTAKKVGTKIFIAVKNVVKPVFKKIPKLSELPTYIIGLVRRIPAGISRAMAILRRIPVVGWVAAATAALLLLIAHSHGRRSGQIDQKYADREKLFIMAR